MDVDKFGNISKITLTCCELQNVEQMVTAVHAHQMLTVRGSSTGGPLETVITKGHRIGLSVREDAEPERLGEIFQ